VTTAPPRRARTARRAAGHAALEPLAWRIREHPGPVVPAPSPRVPAPPPRASAPPRPRLGPRLPRPARTSTPCR